MAGHAELTAYRHDWYILPPCVQNAPQETLKAQDRKKLQLERVQQG